MTKKEYEKIKRVFDAIDYIKNGNNKTLNGEQYKRIIFSYDVLKDLIDKKNKKIGE